MTPTPDATLEEVLIDELPCWRLRNQFGEAVITSQGAQLLSYTPHGQPPVVWLSEQAQHKKGIGVRGGIPLCWPWFGELARNPETVRAMVQDVDGAPFHGLVRTADWVMAAGTCEAGLVVIDFHLDLPNGIGDWPHPAMLQLRCRLGDALELELSTHNFGDEAITVSQALHTYFAVSDSRHVQLTGLEGTRYLDTLQDWTEQPQAGPVTFTAETDRLYLGITQPVVIHDSQWQRDIHVTAGNSNSAVVWNPWIDKSLRLSQFADDAWQRMLCVETARVADDVMVIAPGKTETLCVQIRSVTRA